MAEKPHAFKPDQWVRWRLKQTDKRDSAYARRLEARYGAGPFQIKEVRDRTPPQHLGHPQTVTLWMNSKQTKVDFYNGVWLIPARTPAQRK